MILSTIQIGHPSRFEILLVQFDQHVINEETVPKLYQISHAT